MSSASTYRGESIRDAIFEEIAWGRVENLTVVQMRLERKTPEGLVVATPLTRKQAVWLAERNLLPVRCCEDDLLARLRELTLYPADWAKLLEELRKIAEAHPDAKAAEYVKGERQRAGQYSVTRVYDVPVINFVPGFLS